jgi:predicted transcriptional regulator
VSLLDLTIDTRPSGVQPECMSDSGDTEIVEKVRNKGGRPKGAKRAVSRLSQGELANMVLDYARGVQQQDIARKFGVSESAVSQIVDKFKPAFSEMQNVEEYRKVKGQILDSVALATLKQISNPSKMKRASLRDLGYCYDVVTKHSRLEAGLSTSNVATQTVSISLPAEQFNMTDN